MLEVIRTSMLSDGTKWDPLRTALLEAHTDALIPGTSGGRVEFTRYEPNRVELSTDSEGTSVLVLSENHYPGWRAYLDGLRKQVADAGLTTVDKLGGALRRTLAAIEPYLMQLDLERR